MRLMSYTSAMEQGLVPRIQTILPQMPQGPSLAGAVTGIGVGQEGTGNLVPAAQSTPAGNTGGSTGDSIQGNAGGDVLRELMPQTGPNPQQGQQQMTGSGTMLRQNVTPNIRGQLRQGLGLASQPVTIAARGGSNA